MAMDMRALYYVALPSGDTTEDMYYETLKGTVLAVEVSVKRLSRHLQLLAQVGDGDIVIASALHHIEQSVFYKSLPLGRSFGFTFLEHKKLPLVFCSYIIHYCYECVNSALSIFYIEIGVFCASLGNV